MNDVPLGMVELPLSMAEALHKLNRAGVVVQDPAEATPDYGAHYGRPVRFFKGQTFIGSCTRPEWHHLTNQVVRGILDAVKAKEPPKSQKPYQAALGRQSRTIKRRKLQTSKAAPRLARLSFCQPGG